jgi:hypothetical protein
MQLPSGKNLQKVGVPSHDRANPCFNAVSMFPLSSTLTNKTHVGFAEFVAHEAMYNATHNILLNVDLFKSK